MSAVAARSLFRSSARSVTVRLSAKAALSPFRLHSRKSLYARVFRSPVEISSVSVVSMLSYHTATASALLTSMLSAAQPRSILDYRGHVFKSTIDSQCCNESYWLRPL